MGFVFDARSPNSSFVETIWRTQSERAGTFTSAAVSTWEMVITTFNGNMTITAQGPETKAQATGLTYKTIQQIERARSAVSVLEQGTPILDTAFELGYFDQAHLTNSLKRFIGRTPTEISRKSTVG
jgi:hypothetical protein